MVTSKERLLSLMWLFICSVMLCAPTALGQRFTITPDNTTVNMGKSATFSCTTTSNNTAIPLNFTARFPLLTYILQCPGKSMSFPSMSLYGTCDSTSNQVSATWQMSNIGSDINGSAFICSANGLGTYTGYLWISGASKYFLMLFGCVTGGFFGILIVFSIAYVSLKRSEKLQECFKGKEEEDVIGGVVEENLD